VLPGVIAHRLRPSDDTMPRSADIVAATLIEAVPLP
jgi:hypothetical protein